MHLVLGRIRVRVFEAAEPLAEPLAESPVESSVESPVEPPAEPPAKPPVELPAIQEYDRQAAPSVTDLDAWYAADHRLVAYQRSERQEAPGLEVVRQLEVMVDAGQAVVVDAEAAQNTNVHQCQGG